ncbi:hypothetical protein HZU83_21290, partial [Sphaerotilus montanus]|nr:hypothetical protein [Sphaerotilus montanus]
VARVEFYRVEPNGAVVRLGTDTFLPYAWDTGLWACRCCCCAAMLKRATSPRWSWPAGC